MIDKPGLSPIIPPLPGRRVSGTWSRNPLVITAVLLSSLIFDTLPGYLFGFVGLFLLWRSKTFGLYSRVGLTLMVLLSRELFRFFSPPASPNPLFRFEPSTIATSSSLWVQLIVAWAFGILLLISLRKMRPQTGPERGEGRRGLAVALIAGVVMAGVIGVVTYRFLGLGSDFHLIELGPDGKWIMRHEPFGVKAILSPQEIASITLETKRVTRKTGLGYSTRIRLTQRDGRALAMKTESTQAIEELRKLSATAGLPPGTVTIDSPQMHWANGRSGFTPEALAGVYEGPGQERIFEFRRNNGRFEGTEAFRVGGKPVIRALDALKLSEEGEIEFTPEESTFTFFEKSEEPGGKNIRLHFELDHTPLGRGRFAPGGLLEIDGQRYQRKGI